MVNDAIELLRRKAESFEIGLNLLPEKFTLTQLQNLYEAIYDEILDKRNFRKKFFTETIFEKLDEKDKCNSKKGAFYYKLTDNAKNKLRLI